MSRLHYIAAATLFAASCGPPTEPVTEPVSTWLDTREAGEAPPGRLSEVGLYLEAGTTAVHPRAVAYEPRWPLWSNGLAKSRFLVLPEAARVTTGDVWEFPDDTMLFKTFSDDDGPVETRLMWKAADGWEWSTYVWDDQGQDAERTEGRRSVDVETTVDGETLGHKVPNEIDCRKCHEPDANGVLGFEPLQLDAAVNDLNVFDSAPAVARIDHDDEATRELLGWFIGNCTSCHNGAYDHDQSSFSLLPGDALENIVDEETESSASAQGIRVVPGDPASSILFQSVSRETDDPEVKPMPPIGVQVLDEQAIERLRAWIGGLP